MCHMRRKQLLADNECINEALQPRGAGRDKEMSIIVVGMTQDAVQIHLKLVSLSRIINLCLLHI